MAAVADAEPAEDMGPISTTHRALLTGRSRKMRVRRLMLMSDAEVIADALPR